jgi:hypothetical protein
MRYFDFDNKFEGFNTKLKAASMVFMLNGPGRWQFTTLPIVSRQIRVKSSKLTKIINY